MRACARCFKDNVLIGVRRIHSAYSGGWWKSIYQCHKCGHIWSVRRKVDDVVL